MCGSFRLLCVQYAYNIRARDKMSNGIIFHNFIFVLLRSQIMLFVLLFNYKHILAVKWEPKDGGQRVLKVSVVDEERKAERKVSVSCSAA